MVPVADTVKMILEEQGRTQTWVINRMNCLKPDIAMDRSKFSAIATGKRKMSGDELLIFCKALEVSPDRFLKTEMEVV